MFVECWIPKQTMFTKSNHLNIIKEIQHTTSITFVRLLVSSNFANQLSVYSLLFFWHKKNVITIRLQTKQITKQNKIECTKIVCRHITYFSQVISLLYPYQMGSQTVAFSRSQNHLKTSPKEEKTFFLRWAVMIKWFIIFIKAIFFEDHLFEMKVVEMA